MYLVHNDLHIRNAFSESNGVGESLDDRAGQCCLRELRCGPIAKTFNTKRSVDLFNTPKRKKEYQTRPINLILGSTACQTLQITVVAF